MLIIIIEMKRQIKQIVFCVMMGYLLIMMVCIKTMRRSNKNTNIKLDDVDADMDMDMDMNVSVSNKMS